MISDLIDRNDAVEAIEFEKVYMTAYRGSSNGYDNEGNPLKLYNKGLDDAIKAINNLPSEDSERKWIPVTEALPDEEKDVLVTVHFDGHKSPTVDLPPSDYVEIASHVDGFWSSLSDEYKVAWKKHHVVAWMPIPEPYKGE